MPTSTKVERRLWEISDDLRRLQEEIEQICAEDEDLQEPLEEASALSLEEKLAEWDSTKECFEAKVLAIAEVTHQVKQLIALRTQEKNRLNQLIAKATRRLAVLSDFLTKNMIVAGVDKVSGVRHEISLRQSTSTVLKDGVTVDDLPEEILTRSDPKPDLNAIARGLKEGKYQNYAQFQKSSYVVIK